MSKAIAFLRLRDWATACVPITPAAGPDFEHANAFRLGAADAEKSARRLNHEKVAAKSVVRDPPLYFFNITPHPRPDISVGDNSRTPLELAILLRQLVEAEMK